MILIVGATGLLGGMITQQLLAQGKEVRILVRHNSPSEGLAQQGMATPAQTLIDAGAQPVYGDLKERSSLDSACQGIDTVITTANAVLRGGDDNLESVDLHGTQTLIDAAKAAGVRHFVYTSAAGSAPGHPHPLFDAKGRCEEHLKKSGLTYTILKPGVFMEIWIGTVVGMPLSAGQPVTLVGQGACKVAFVSIVDVAAYAVTAVDNPNAENQEIYIAGPASYSWTKVVEAVGRATGQQIPIQYVATGEPVPLIPPSMAPILAAQEIGDSLIDMSETSSRYGVDPTSLDTFAGRFFGAGG
ncbi:MAG: SDR family oxidoreductase [Caldilineaceae bacterium]|nr:SDR family oxidoreductase [Caldilineaceae bacterium]